MKRTDKHIHLFNPSGCISENAFFRYLNHELNSSEMHAVEEHLSECLFCSDALEGYEKQTDKARVQSDFHNLKNEVFIKLNNQQAFKKKDNKRYLVLAVSIAASFIIIISGYYLFRFLPTNSKQQELAINTPVQKNDVPQAADQRGPAAGNTMVEKSGKDKIDEGTISKSEYKEKTGMKAKDDRSNGYFKGGDQLNESDGDETETKKTTGTKAGNTITTNDETAKPMEQSGESRIVSIKDAESAGQTGLGIPALNQREELEKESIQNETQSIVDKVLPANDISIEEKVVSGKKNKSIESKENQKQPSAATGGVMRSVVTPTLNSAMTAYNSGNYDEAKPQFEYLISSEKNNYAAIYYLAMCFYNKGEKESALIQLNKLLKKQNNPFYELGMWQKAQIAEESNNKKQAAEIYREIIKNNGSMKTKAAQRIDELEK